MLDPLMAEFLKDFAQELYFRAQAAKSREERAAVKGVQHSLERALEKYAVASFERAVKNANKGLSIEVDEQLATALEKPHG